VIQKGHHAELCDLAEAHLELLDRIAAAEEAAGLEY